MTNLVIFHWFKKYFRPFFMWVLAFWGKNEWFGLFLAAVTGFVFPAFCRRGSRSKFKFKSKFKSKQNLLLDLNLILKHPAR
ncbi:MAG: hypothetical protein D6714_15400 [Bacteroidetes bacterium]|nr:MAG: hypothetical protein D6714_15400 [Bacteroidota bacterium]